MTGPEFIALAIEFETEAARLYAHMQERAEGSERQLLQLLERQELAHRRLLEEYDAGDIKGIIQFPPELTAAMPSAPEDTLGLTALIEFAVARERHAYHAYHAASGSVSGPFRDFVEGLARFELEHEERLKGLRDL